MNTHFSKNLRLLALLATLGAASVAFPAAAQNLVTNGGFEAGSLAGWSGSILSNPYSGVYCPGAGAAPEGGCEAFLGTNGSSDTLSQLLTTVAGQTYTVSFLFQSDGSVPSNLSVNFGGQPVYTVADTSSTALQTLSFSAPATGTSTALTFSFRNDPGYFVLDAVSVAAVPEPATLALALAGLVGLGLKRKWSSRKS